MSRVLGISAGLLGLALLAGCGAAAGSTPTAKLAIPWGEGDRAEEEGGEGDVLEAGGAEEFADGLGRREGDDGAEEVAVGGAI